MANEKFSAMCNDFYASVINSLATHLSSESNVRELIGKDIQEIGTILHTAAGVARPKQISQTPVNMGSFQPAGGMSLIPSEPAKAGRTKKNFLKLYTYDDYLNACKQGSKICAYMTSRGSDDVIDEAGNVVTRGTKHKVCCKPAINNDVVLDPMSYKCNGCIDKGLGYMPSLVGGKSKIKPVGYPVSGFNSISSQPPPLITPDSTFNRFLEIKEPEPNPPAEDQIKASSNKYLAAHKLFYPDYDGYRNLVLQLVDQVDMKCIGKIVHGDLVITQDCPVPDDWHSKDHLVELNSDDKSFLDKFKLEYKYAYGKQ